MAKKEFIPLNEILKHVLKEEIKQPILNVLKTKPTAGELVDKLKAVDSIDGITKRKVEFASMLNEITNSDVEKAKKLSDGFDIVSNYVDKPEAMAVVEKSFTEAKGDWKKVIADKPNLKNLDEIDRSKIFYVASLTDLTDSKTELVNELLPKAESLRELAFKLDKKSLAAAIKPEMLPGYLKKESSKEWIKEATNNYAGELQTKLFKVETSAVLQRMTEANELPFTISAKEGLVKIFKENPDFNIRTTSAYSIIEKSEVLKELPEEQRKETVKSFINMQRSQALASEPDDVKAILKSGRTSAMAISDLPEAQAIKLLSNELGENGTARARQIHRNAVKARLRNEQALIALKEAWQGTGVAMIDKPMKHSQQIKSEQSASVSQPVVAASGGTIPAGTKDDGIVKSRLSWDLLFGDADVCECGECNSVYSAAAYFVELLQYLRNNNIDSNQTGPLVIQKDDPKSIAGTPLEKLFQRRPDLGCLELTCKNINTVLPYIDLVNEVMENYVAYHKTKAFNVSEDETTGELLSQPQHTEYKAYCILHEEVYPFTLPYHQPIDAIRIFLEYLGTSRYELINRFRSQRKAGENESEAEKQELDRLHEEFLNRAANAEFLGLTQQEYVILTKQGFKTKEYWDKACKTEHTQKEYEVKIGLKKVHEYYGYETEQQMLNADEAEKEGLTFVKKQFLRRTGVEYKELVDLLKTETLNPNMPRGKALTIALSIHFNYQTLNRFKQLLGEEFLTEALVKFEWLLDMVTKMKAKLTSDGNAFKCPSSENDVAVSEKDLRHWLKCDFEKIGKMIVLESGDGPRWPAVGQLWNPKERKSEGWITKNGILKKDGVIIGSIGPDGILRDIAGTNFLDTITYSNDLTIRGDDEKILAYVIPTGIFSDMTGYEYTNQVHWLPIIDSCDLDKIRLIHLDGTPLSVEEYDCFQRFIRLWRKLGWTIDETDKALVGGSINGSFQSNKNGTEDCNDFHDTDTDCESDSSSNGDNIDQPCHSEPLECDCTITPEFLHQVVAIKKLATKTSIELIRLLTFWNTISTVGEKSLYKRLFLTHNLVRQDPVFKADEAGNYLTKETSITAHAPVIMAALNLSGDDLNAMLQFHFPDVGKILDKLTIANISRIYRYRLLARSLGLRVEDFLKSLSLFGNVFATPLETWQFLRVWSYMEDAGFNHRQLNYVIKGVDDLKKPFKPSNKTIVQLAKVIYDGLNEIEKTHSNSNEAEAMVIDLAQTKASLIVDSELALRLTLILTGGQTLDSFAVKDIDLIIPKEKLIYKKLKYNKATGRIFITGILTEAEETEYKSLEYEVAGSKLPVSNFVKWNEALGSVKKKQARFFNECLGGIFEDIKNRIPALSQEVDHTVLVLQSADIIMSDDQVPSGVENPSTAPKKAQVFLKVFMPYLRLQLRQRFIIDTLAGQVNTSKDVATVLLTNILKSEDGTQPLINSFEGIRENARSEGISSYLLISPAMESYMLAVRDQITEPKINFDNAPLIWQENPEEIGEWSCALLAFEAGKVYKLEILDDETKRSQLLWRTRTTLWGPIPTSALLPDFASDKTETGLIKLKKAAMIASGFNLSGEEISYLAGKIEFGEIDFNKLTLDNWKRLEAYTRLRNSLPRTELSFSDFFKWANSQDTTDLSKKIEQVSQWKSERVEKFLSASHFNLSKSDFRSEQQLLKLQKAIIVTDKVTADIDLLFHWAYPTSKFHKSRAIADSIQWAIKSQYKQEDYEKVIKPLNDKLRGNQKKALTDYLLQQPELIDYGVEDPDGLFEYFLIDVQMDACMETSRIKQAISSVQLFVQRCFLGLEEDHNNIPSDLLDRKRWNWMQRYRIWEANRKVFLYPENWIESNLRDDKSPFFKELESELLQKDVSQQNVTDALKNYLYKIDEVSNMEVVGLCIQGTKEDDGWSPGSKLHVFSRTRNAPYFFYYRYFDIKQGNWYPWEKMQVDIPSYDVTDPNTGGSIGNGTFLIPVCWNSRLFVFFPQMQKKSKSNSSSLGTINSETEVNLDSLKPIQYWEVKVGFSEYRNNKWTQKQLGKESVESWEIAYDKPVNNNTVKITVDIQYFKFIAIPKDNGIYISFDTLKDSDGGFTRTFKFNGTSVSLLPESEKISAAEDIPINYFNTDGSGVIKDNSGRTIRENRGKVFSWQLEPVSLMRVDKNLSFSETDQKTTIDNFFDGTSKFHSDDSNELLAIINTKSIKDFFDWISNDPSESFGYSLTGSSNAIPTVYHELKKPYSLYNWELFFHSPMMIADSLSKSMQFEEAMKWYHFVFNPMAEGDDKARFWNFYPFKHTDSQRILDCIFNHLEPNEGDAAISEWRDNPFMPHSVARNRPVSYMKWVVMKYIDNLLAWGDYLYRQDTIESLNQATQLYVLAGHILGPRPNFIPKRGKIKPQTYLSLLDKWDAFSNAMTELEIEAPFSNQVDMDLTKEDLLKGEEAFPNVFGFATSLYFCIPNNPKLMGYWETIADRLFKIRHCQNIEGVFRKLPLFEPPIDPALLVKAAAQGLSIASVLNDLNSPMPNYRFYYLLQKALELCGELKSMGGAMLSAIEKKDNEAMALIRAKHESTMHNLIIEIKKSQLEEANKTLDSLKQNRKSPEHRMKYYLQLIGEDAGKVPGTESEFNELANSIESPVNEGGLKLIKYEKEDMDKSNLSADLQLASGITETLASILYAIPVMGTDAKPFGVGVGIEFGGTNLGQLTQAITKGMQIAAGHFSHQASSASKKGSLLRSLQDRIMQVNAAGYEIKQIDKQITAQQIRINISNQEISNQQKQIDNSLEIEEFLKNKYTNEELYAWMRSSLKTLYRQVYNLAYEISRKAEKAYCFERGLSNSNFLQLGYWDDGREGLLSGERLYVGLKQLEAAYQEKRGHDFEITKHVSLQQVNPIALLVLRETGTCEFDLSEPLFDMDFPGHYMRRIKSVSISVPCLAGPYSSINGTLRLLQHKYRLNSIAKDANSYPEKTEETDDRFATVNVPITGIATSSGQNDSGTFELNFSGERYLPFEGAGVISKWRIQFPGGFRQFDYKTISDFVIHIRYTAMDGGDKLGSIASETLQKYIGSVEDLSQQEGLFALIDLQHEFSNEWAKASQIDSGRRKINLGKLTDRLPVFTKGKNVTAKNVNVFTTNELTSVELKSEGSQDSTELTKVSGIEKLKSFGGEFDFDLDKGLSLDVDSQDKLKDLFMVVKYVLTSNHS
jgi:Tc toxin complex TcA C-terminal TcB-binding domain/Neuraminidase-like domain/Salmonella virulence plasmid 28.1kDa A protein